MSSLEPFVLRIKPTLDAFLRQSDKQTLNKLENELVKFNWPNSYWIFNIHLLVPLVVKLDELSSGNQELRTGCMQCICLTTSKVYLKELTALRTMLIIVLKQIRECDTAAMRPNLSEEIKLAAVQCIMECLRRSTTDVLEKFYHQDSSMILGQILLTLVDIVEHEKYKKLIITSLECIMTVFYVHDDADSMDVVLRNQVADVLFIFLPKIVTILYQTALADEKIGENIKIISIKALSRILCIIYEETMEDENYVKYDVDAFKKLISASHTTSNDLTNESDILAIKKNRDQIESHMNKMQVDGRTIQWIQASSKRLCVIFKETSILRSNPSTKVRKEYAELSCLLIQKCAHNLKENFAFLLENIVAFMEDDDIHIRNLCSVSVERLQKMHSNSSIFDENSEQIFDEHLARLPRIIQRCDDSEQYVEFMFSKGFLRSLSSQKLQLLLSIPKNLEMFCMCLLSALDLKISLNLLVEEYSLRDIDTEIDFVEASKLPWRNFKNVNSKRCLNCLEEICFILGQASGLNRIIVDHLMEMLHQHNPAMNEILLVMLWLSTAKEKDGNFRYNDLYLAKQFLDQLLDDEHWNLCLEPDNVTKMKVDKHTEWFMDHTPGLYESAIEVRTQDCDSDDEPDGKYLKNIENTLLLNKNLSDFQYENVTIADAEFNVLHTCIVMDCLGHCALFVGERFDRYIFQALHKVLLKLAHSNSMVYQSANFALVCIQKALKFNTVTELIERHTDYIAYHLNTLLKRAPDSKSAVDILTVVLQFSSRSTLPYLESIFQTIYFECSKSYQTTNLNSYLKVFIAFFRHMSSWLLSCNHDLQDVDAMEVENIHTEENETDLLASWLELLIDTKPAEDDFNVDSTNEQSNDNVNTEPSNQTAEEENVEKLLPRHIEMIKSISEQVVKFLSSSDERLNILSLECLGYGLPLLKDYENELLPLVHSLWPPLVEKFRQRKALVLNRCFSLLSILATCAKDFITKRSLNDVLPFLKIFLQKAAQHSVREKITAQTQEYKLQLKLLQEFPNLIVCLNLDGKHLYDISEIVAEYLSQEQPKELQESAVSFFTKLRFFNGPSIYLSVVKKSRSQLYESNVKKILLDFGIK